MGEDIALPCVLDVLPVTHPGLMILSTPIGHFWFGDQYSVPLLPFLVLKNRINPFPPKSKLMSDHFRERASCLEVPCSLPRKIREGK